MVLEVRLLGKRWSRKRFYSKRVLRWATALGYLLGLIGATFVLSYSLIYVVRGSTTVPAGLAIAILTYAALIVGVGPAIDPLATGLLDAVFFLFTPLIKGSLRYYNARYEESEVARLRQQRSERLGVLGTYSDIMIMEARAGAALDRDPTNPDLRERCEHMQRERVRVEDLLTAPDEPRDPRNRPYRDVNEYRADFDRMMRKFLADS